MQRTVVTWQLSLQILLLILISLLKKNTYHVNCWADEATEAPTRIDAPAMLDAVGDVILENGTAIEGGDAKKVQ